MNSDDVRTFLGRTRALVDRSPPETLSETRSLIVEPLLYCLGWDTYDRSCRTDVAVGGETIEYDCTIDGITAVFVAVEPFDDSLSERRLDRLESAMVDTGVDRAIYTDGRQILFLAGTEPIERFTCELPSLAEHEHILREYTSTKARTRLAGHARELTARKLAGERDGLVDTITDELVDVGGTFFESEIETVVDRFLDHLIDSFHGSVDVEGSRSVDTEKRPSDISGREMDHECQSDDAGRPGEIAEFDAKPDVDRTATNDIGSNGRTDDHPGKIVTEENESPDATEATAKAKSAESDQSIEGTENGDEPDETEYVVRFFAERGSIGGISHSRSAQALVHATEFLFERGLSGVRLPWAPDGETEVVLSNEPIDGNGTQLSNGVYLNTGGSVERRSRRVEQLATRAGLRAMLVGDWSDTQSDASDSPDVGAEHRD